MGVRPSEVRTPRACELPTDSSPFANRSEENNPETKPEYIADVPDASPASGPSPNGLERAIRSGTDLERIVDEYIQALAAFGRFPLFQRAGVLVDVVQSATTEPDRGRMMSAEGIARIRALPLPRIHELLTMVAQFERSTEGGTFVRASPPKNIAPTLMARGYWPGIPVLYGISRWPIFRVDGSLCTTPGYDAKTGLLYEPTCDVRVPTSPTKDDARRAIETLLELLVDFPFVERRVHRLFRSSPLPSRAPRDAWVIPSIADGSEERAFPSIRAIVLAQANHLSEDVQLFDGMPVAPRRGRDHGAL